MGTILLFSLLAASQIEAQPQEVVPGEADGASLEVRAVDAEGQPVRHPQITMSASIGRISAVQDLGNGRFRARYVPHVSKKPQLALILADVRGEGVHYPVWSAIRLDARATLKIDTKPNAEVTVKIGERSFGPALADGRGHLSLPALVRPGDTQAMVRAIDRAGNATERPLDLTPAPVTQVGLWTSGEQGSTEGAGAIEVRIFAVTPAGQPLTDAALLRVRFASGMAPPKPLPLGDGVFTFRYQPAPAADHERISVSVGDSPLQTSVDLQLVPDVNPSNASVLRTQLHLRILDAASGPIEHARIDARIAEQAADMVPTGHGNYQLDLPGRSGPVDLRIQLENPPPRRRGWSERGAWAPSVGIVASGQSNFAYARSLGPRASVGVRVARTRWELLGEADSAFFAPLSLTPDAYHVGNGPVPQDVSGSLRSFGGTVGARYSLPVTSWAAVHGGVAVGLAVTSGTLVRLGGSPKSFSQLVPVGRGFLGGTFELGPGRLIGQFEATDAHGAGPVYGNLAGLGIAAGYLLDF